jgi:hypothetical protein
MIRSAPYIIIAIVLSLGGGYLWGKVSGRKAEQAKASKAQVRAVEEARTIEHQQQEAVNEALRKQNDELVGINAALAVDLDRLRNRSPRRMPNAAKASCAGANGAELAREHAEFLTRFAALAAKQDAALATSYTACDAVATKQ